LTSCIIGRKEPASIHDKNPVNLRIRLHVFFHYLPRFILKPRHFVPLSGGAIFCWASASTTSRRATNSASSTAANFLAPARSFQLKITVRVICA
jgi:hypothetical protein